MESCAQTCGLLLGLTDFELEPLHPRGSGLAPLSLHSRPPSQRVATPLTANLSGHHSFRPQSCTRRCNLHLVRPAMRIACSTETKTWDDSMYISNSKLRQTWLPTKWEGRCTATGQPPALSTTPPPPPSSSPPSPLVSSLLPSNPSHPATRCPPSPIPPPP